MIKSYLISLVSFIVLDLIWLGFVMKKFNMTQLAGIGRIVNGEFQLMMVPAVLTYLLMAAAVTFFVLPASASSSFIMTFVWGAFMGLIAYGIFDLTNLAILKDYPLAFAAVDMAWGTFVFGAVTVITKWISLKI